MSSDAPAGADNAYVGLHEHDADASHWAFGAEAEDPLAGVDTTLPPGVDGAALAAYCLALGDDALVAGHRLSEWCGRAPELEEDVAMANIALDLLGQARLLLARAAAADPGVVPLLPAGSPVPAEDALAFFRPAEQFRNVRLLELPNGDFAHTMVRLLLDSLVRLALFQRLTASRDGVLAAVAARGVREVAYHRDHAARWVVTLGRGTSTSRARLCAALEELAPWFPETLGRHPLEERAAALGVGAVAAEVAPEVDAALGDVLAAAGVPRPAGSPAGGASGRDGGDGHTPALAAMLAEMQSVARAHPTGRW